jgi:hypothetical protein
MADGPEWFAPKRYGYGAGFPIAWQGWLLSGVYLATVLGAAYLLKEKVAAFAAIVITATLLFVLITARTTRGGWRWRWGKED